MSMYPIETSMCKILLKWLEYGEQSKKILRHGAQYPCTVHYTARWPRPVVLSRNANKCSYFEPVR